MANRNETKRAQHDGRNCTHAHPGQAHAEWVEHRRADEPQPADAAGAAAAADADPFASNDEFRSWCELGEHTIRSLDDFTWVDFVRPPGRRSLRRSCRMHAQEASDG